MTPRAKKIFTLSIVAVFLALLGGYAYFQSLNFLAGPTISIDTPKNGETFSNALVSVAGIAKNISFISLNDRPIFVDASGNFSEKTILMDGYNVIKLSAKDRFGKTVEKRLEVVLKEPQVLGVRF